MQGKLRIDNDALAAIQGHAERDCPAECCGLLLGRRAGRSIIVSEIRPSNNLSRDRRSRYLIDSDLVVRAALASRRGGAELVGFYHSHPQGGAEPSRFDRREAWSGMVYLIVGLAGGQGAHVRAWSPAGPGGIWHEVSIYKRGAVLPAVSA